MCVMAIVRECADVVVCVLSVTRMSEVEGDTQQALLTLSLMTLSQNNTLNTGT